MNIDPLVMQSYKTLMCLESCWVVLLIGEEFTYTPWGIVSGLFWVPAGTSAIFAIRNAGLAVSQGIWSALIVLVSFFWGIFIFDEAVASRVVATFAILLMVAGLWGMGHYSVPAESHLSYTPASDLEEDEPVNFGDHRDDSSFRDEEDDIADGSIEMERSEMNHRSAIDDAGLDMPLTEISEEQYFRFLGCKWSRRRLGLACAKI